MFSFLAVCQIQVQIPVYAWFDFNLIASETNSLVLERNTRYANTLDYNMTYIEGPYAACTNVQST